MTIKNKLILGFGLSLLLLLTLGVVAYTSTNTLVETAALKDQTDAKIQVLDDVLNSLESAETSQRGYLITGDAEYLVPYLSDVKSIGDREPELERILVDANNPSRLEALRSAVSTRLAELKYTIDVRRDKGFAAALEQVKINNSKGSMKQARSIIAQLEQEQKQQLREHDLQAERSSAAIKTTILSVTALAFVLVGILGTLILRSITGPLGKFAGLVAKVGKGDLSEEADASGHDEFAQLGGSVNQMIAGLRNVARETRSATVNLSSAAAEILAATQEQAASTGEQAAAVQQTTVTMDEIRQSGLQIAERARQVAASAQDTSASSSDGLLAVQNTGRAMESIREQAEAVAENIVRLSERTQVIGEIIASVNDIAEQSHLLALNAAIQAAAAGEHGRTFAVVAGEIKNLADQSKEATVQVRSILGEIQRGINSSVMLTEEAVKRIESGKHYSEAADGAIRKMSENIQQSVQAFQQIVAGSNQQHIGFEQVLQAVRNIGQASQQTAIATRQLEKAAGNLNTLGLQLKTVGDIYRI